MRQGAFFLYHKETFGNQAGLMILILIGEEQLKVDAYIHKQETAITLEKLKISLTCIFKVLQDFDNKRESNS